MAEELGSELGRGAQRILRKAEGIIDARQVRELLGVGSEDSSASSSAKGWGEAIGAMAKGMAGLGELQQASMKMVMENLSQPKGNDSATALLATLLPLMFEMMAKGKGDNEIPASVQLILEMQKEQIAELKAQRGMSPFEAHFQEYAMRSLVEGLNTKNDPISQLKSVKEALGGLGELGSLVGLGGDPQYSPGALQHKTIELEKEKVLSAERTAAEERNFRHMMMTEGYPAIAQSIGAGFASIIGKVLSPVTSPEGWSPDVQAAMAEMGGGEGA